MRKGKKGKNRGKEEKREKRGKKREKGKGKEKPRYAKESNGKRWHCCVVRGGEGLWGLRPPPEGQLGTLPTSHCCSLISGYVNCTEIIFLPRLLP